LAVPIDEKVEVLRNLREMTFEYRTGRRKFLVCKMLPERGGRWLVLDRPTAVHHGEKGGKVLPCSPFFSFFSPLFISVCAAFP
jgi:hypothetical protein